MALLPWKDVLLGLPLMVQFWRPTSTKDALLPLRPNPNSPTITAQAQTILRKPVTHDTHAPTRATTHVFIVACGQLPVVAPLSLAYQFSALSAQLCGSVNSASRLTSARLLSLSGWVYKSHYF
ncbi:hypothetical protein SDJN03_21678, partial [Cucurbita argyrosperma subsp. sororia]